jgi:hypothetical protein
LTPRPPAVTKRKAKDLFENAAKKARLEHVASASKKKPGKQWNDSFQNCERHVHCIIESHMNYNMHILYTLNMLKYEKNVVFVVIVFIFHKIPSIY